MNGMGSVFDGSGNGMEGGEGAENRATAFFSESLEKKKTTCRKGDDGGCDSSIQFSRSYSL